MRYAGPNQGFGWHYDGLDCSAAAATGGQRIATLLVYLDANCNGGRTVFRDLVGGCGCGDGEDDGMVNKNNRLAVEPRKGRALLFFPSAGQDAYGITDSGWGGEVFVDGTSEDRRTLHAGEPPEGEGGTRWN